MFNNNIQIKSCQPQTGGHGRYLKEYNLKEQEGENVGGN